MKGREGGEVRDGWIFWNGKWWGLGLDREDAVNAKGFQEALDLLVNPSALVHRSREDIDTRNSSESPNICDIWYLSILRYE